MVGQRRIPGDADVEHAAPPARRRGAGPWRGTPARPPRAKPWAASERDRLGRRRRANRSSSGHRRREQRARGCDPPARAEGAVELRRVADVGDGRAVAAQEVVPAIAVGVASRPRMFPRRSRPSGPASPCRRSLRSGSSVGPVGPRNDRPVGGQLLALNRLGGSRWDCTRHAVERGSPAPTERPWPRRRRTRGSSPRRAPRRRGRTSPSGWVPGGRAKLPRTWRSPVLPRRARTHTCALEVAAGPS